jgi:multiple sugar transport system substrate-binding protein
MGDVVGWTYRKDWFTKPELQKEFKEKYGWDLDAPKTFDQFKQVAEFFQKREIDGKTVYGASIYTERGSEGVTMGVMDVLYSYGFKYENPDKPYEMEGFVNSDRRRPGLEFYKELYKCCTPPGASNVYMGESADAFKSGQVAMHMNFAFTWPGLQKDEAVGGDKIGYFANPAGPNGDKFAQLAARASRSFYSTSRTPRSVHQVVRQSRRAEEVVVARRLLLPEGGGRRPDLPGKPALRENLPRLDGHREGLLGRAELRLAAAGFTEALP